MSIAIETQEWIIIFWQKLLLAFNLSAASIKSIETVTGICDFLRATLQMTLFNVSSATDVQTCITLIWQKLPLLIFNLSASMKYVETVVGIFIFLRAELVESLDLKLRLCRWIILVMKTWSACKLSSVTHLLLDPIRYRLRWEAKSNRQLRSLLYLHLKSFKYLRSTFWTRVITREVD